MPSRPEAAPTPVLGTLDHARRQRIAFDITANGVKMLVFLDGETFETSLIQVSATDRVVRYMPAHGMGMRQPTEVCRKLSFLSRPHNEVPMVSHHAPGEQPRRVPLLCFDHDFLERLVVLFLAKQRQTGHRPIENVVNQSTRRYSCSSWHGGTLPQVALSCQY